MSQYWIKNGRLIDPTQSIDQITDIYIDHGRIVSLDQAPKDFKNPQIIDASQQIISPSFIDFYTYLREPGEEHKANIKSEINAAIAQGITTLCCSPDTHPIADNPAVVNMIQCQAEKMNKAQVMVHGALTQQLNGQQLSEMATLQQAGCQALTNDYQPIKSTLILRRTLEYAATFDLLTIIRPQDQALANQGCAHEGAVSTLLGLPAIPEAAETVAIASTLALIELTQARVHFHGISCAASVRLIAQAKKQRLPISASVNIHQLHLTENDLMDFDPNCHVYPPLRSYQDREALRVAVSDGTIDIICSDHQPHNRDSKEAPFPATQAGISGLDTLLPLTLKLVEEKVFSLSQAIQCLSINPARLLKLERGLKIGNKAHLCIFDMHQRHYIDPEKFISKGKNSPFKNWEVGGKNTFTFFNGNLVYQAEKLS